MQRIRIIAGHTRRDPRGALARLNGGRSIRFQKRWDGKDKSWAFNEKRILEIIQTLQGERGKRDMRCQDPDLR